MSSAHQHCPTEEMHLWKLSDQRKIFVCVNCQIGRIELSAQPNVNLPDFHSVGAFHQKFGLTNVTFEEPGPREVTSELIEFRLKFLQEELDEIVEGYGEEDWAKVADGLVDLVYVALGTAHLHGFPWAELFAEVQRANMAKMRAQSAEESLRKSTFDVIKPKGWTPPDIKGVLRKHGWVI